MSIGRHHTNSDKKTEVRLGGIYSLERIASDSNQDHWPSMKVLAADFRENDQRRARKEFPDTEFGRPSPSLDAAIDRLKARANGST